MLQRARRAACVAVLMIGVAGSGARADTSAPSPDVVAAVMPSVVTITSRGLPSKQDGKWADESGSAPPQVEVKYGTGFIVDPSGIILTNRHVVEGAYEIVVMRSNGTSVAAKFIGEALGYDLALIKIEAAEALPSIRLGDSDKIRVGDPVMAVGDALGLEASVSAGIVSALHRQIKSAGYDQYVQTDATINKGNSGGPLFNRAGEAIGVNTAILTLAGGSIGIGFAIPSNDAKFLLGQVRRYGKLRIGWLGLGTQKMTPAIAEALNMPKPQGVLVSLVAANSPAAKAGFHNGDVIRTFDNQPIADVGSLNRSIAMAVDRTVRIEFWRQGATRAVDVPIADWPQPQWTGRPAPLQVTGDGAATAFGMKLDAVTDDTRKTFKIAPQVAGGLVVTDVLANGIAANSGLKKGDVLTDIEFQAVKVPGDFGTLITPLVQRGKRHVLVYVITQGEGRWTTLDVPG